MASAADQCVNTRRVNVGMSEQVGKTNNILLSSVVIHSEEMPQVVWEDLLPVHIGSFAECLHTVKDVAAVNGLSRSGYKDTT